MTHFLHILKIIPLLSILFIIMVGCTLRIGEYPLLPALLLIPVFYWLVFRPDWLSLWSLAGIGIFYDTLMMGNLGISSLLLMLSAIGGYYIRPLLNPQYFYLMWGSFSLYSLCYLVLYGLLTARGFSLLIAWIYGIVIYPLIAWTLGHLQLRLQAYV